MLVAVLVFVAVACAGDRRVRWLMRPSSGPPSVETRAHASWAERPLPRAVACVTGGAAVGLALAGAVGSVAGVLAGVGLAAWIARLEPAQVTKERERVVRDLPLAADLLAACAQAGAPIDRSLGLIASATEGPLARRLAVIVARIELGAAPASQWRLLSTDPALGGLGRTLARAAESGAPPVDGLERFAGDCRRQRRARQLERARGVGVRSAAPLALCFLPAFMLVGVVPTIVGAFANLPW